MNNKGSSTYIEFLSNLTTRPSKNRKKQGAIHSVQRSQLSDFGSLVQISIHTTLVSLIFSITEEDVVVHEGSGIEIGGLDNASIFLRSIIKIHGVTNGETFEP